MPKFRVWITRDTSESGTVEIEAADENEATEKAWQQYQSGSIEDHCAFFEPDDCAGTPYVSDVNELD